MPKHKEKNVVQLNSIIINDRFFSLSCNRGDYCQTGTFFLSINVSLENMMSDFSSSEKKNTFASPAIASSARQ